MLFIFRFQDKANKELMLKFQEGQQTCEMTIDGIAYDYDFQVMNQTNKRTKKARSIRFCSNLPHHWGITDADSLKMLLPVNQGNGQDGSDDRICFVTDPAVMSTLEDLLNGSKRRHDGTGCNCLHGRSTFRLVEAYQVKNRELWRRYQRHVRSIVDKHKQHGSQLTGIDPPVGEALTQLAKDIQVDLAGNELLLLHGTREFDLAKEIAREGFDNRIARSGGLYGSGTYFAAQTCKSAQYATNIGMQEKASARLMGTMLVARVAIGDPYYTPQQCQNLTRAFAKMYRSVFVFVSWCEATHVWTRSQMLPRSTYKETLYAIQQRPGHSVRFHHRKARHSKWSKYRSAGSHGVCDICSGASLSGVYS